MPVLFILFVSDISAANQFFTVTMSVVSLAKQLRLLCVISPYSDGGMLQPPAIKYICLPMSNFNSEFIRQVKESVKILYSGGRTTRSLKKHIDQYLIYLEHYSALLKFISKFYLFITRTKSPCIYCTYIHCSFVKNR